jgi:hypothetical protein
MQNRAKKNFRVHKFAYKKKSSTQKPPTEIFSVPKIPKGQKSSSQKPADKNLTGPKTCQKSSTDKNLL